MKGCRMKAGRSILGVPLDLGLLQVEMIVVGAVQSSRDLGCISGNGEFPYLRCLQ